MNLKSPVPLLVATDWNGRMGGIVAVAVPTAGERYRRGGALRREGAKTALETPKKRSFICFLQIIQLSLPQLFEVVNIGATHGKQNRRQVVTLSYYKPYKSLKSILLYGFSVKSLLIYVNK